MPKILANTPAQVTHARAKPPYLLVRKIMARSEAQAWAQAKLEWDLSHIYFADRDYPGTCLCGHFPIIEHCVLRNHLNGSIATVGNVCVSRFLDLPEVEDLFASLRRIIKNPQSTLSTFAIEHCYQECWLNDWERSFYIDTCKRRQPTPRQLAKRVEINEAIVLRAQRASKGVDDA
jgi:hypothetical protein